jgi:hypothetical protein
MYASRIERAPKTPPRNGPNGPRSEAFRVCPARPDRSVAARARSSHGRAATSGDRVGRLLADLRNPPYCSVYSPSGAYVPPADFKAKAYLGLISWHVVRGTAGTQIISYWQEEDSFGDHRLQFESDLKITGTPFQGTVGDLHARDSTLWPSSLIEFILAASAILGALTVIWATIVRSYWQRDSHYTRCRGYLR